jgi:hypothetical protein
MTTGRYSTGEDLWGCWISIIFVIAAVTGMSVGAGFESTVWGWVAFGATLVGLVSLTSATRATIQSLRNDTRIDALEDAEAFAGGAYWLYLRPFDWDVEFCVYSGQVHWTTSYTDREIITLAECLARTADGHGCRLKIVGGQGSDSVKRAILGDEWREMVMMLMNAAERIVILPSSHAGTLWELEQVQTSGMRAKTFILVPPLAWAAIGKFANQQVIEERQWAARSKMIDGLLQAGLRLPPMDQVLKEGGIYRYDDGGRLEPLPNLPTQWVSDGVPQYDRPTRIVEDGKLAGLLPRDGHQFAKGA